MKMKYLILLVILINSKFSNSQECALINEENNKPLNLSSSVVPQLIGTFRKDLKPGETLPGIFKVYNITPRAIANTNGYCKSTYFKMMFNEEKQELSFILTEEFSSFDDDVIEQNKVEGCDFFLTFQADAVCEIGDTQIDLKYTITDFNMNDPVFDRPAYNLQITFPIASGTSLIKLSDNVKEIKALDKDFSTKNLVFEIIDENIKNLLDVRSLPGSNHFFPVDITAKHLLYLQETITFTLKATDDGSDPGTKSGTTDITITLNDGSELPIPQFDQPFFQGNVDLDSAQVGDVINDQPIKLKETYRSPTIHCIPNDVLRYYFKCDQAQRADELRVVIIKMPDEELWSQSQVFVQQIRVAIENDVMQTSTNIVPFIITLENVRATATTTTPESTTTDSTTTDSTITASTTTDSTTTDSTITDSTVTDSTVTDSTPTDDTPDTPTDSSSSVSSEYPTESTPPDTTPGENNTSDCSDKDQNGDLITVIIILGIIACVLLLALAYGYFKYVRGRKKGDKAPLLDSNLNNNSDDISDNNSNRSEVKLSGGKRNSVDSETYSKPLDALPDKDEIPIQNEIDREPKGLDRLIAEQEENNLLKPTEVKSRKRSMTFSESDDESRQYRENLSEPVTAEVINENKPDPVRKKSVVTFKL